MLTDENKQLHELALKGLKYAFQVSLSNDSSRSQLLWKMKTIKNKLDNWGEEHFNWATTRELIEKHNTLKDSFKLMWLKLT